MPKIELSSKWTCDGRELKPKVGAASGTNTYELNGHPLLVAFGQLVLKLW